MDLPTLAGRAIGRRGLLYLLYGHGTTFRLHQRVANLLRLRENLLFARVMSRTHLFDSVEGHCWLPLDRGAAATGPGGAT